MHSFRTRVALMFGLTAMVALALITVITTRILEAQVAKDQGEALRALGLSTAALLGEGLYERLREIELMADDFSSPTVSLNSPRVRHALARTQRTRKHYSWIGLASSDGIVSTATQDMLTGKDVSARPWFKSGLHEAHVGDVHEAKLLASMLPRQDDGEPLRFVDFAAPVRGSGGEVIGVLGAHANWVWVGEIIAAVRSDTARNEGVRVFILNKDGLVIHRPKGPEGHIEPTRASALPATPTLVNWADGEAYLTAATAIQHPDARVRLGWTIVIRQPEAQAFHAALEVRHTMLTLGVISSALAMVMAWLFAGEVSRPLARLTEAASRIRAGELDARLPDVTNSIELRDLSHSLQDMTNTMLQNQRDLAEANSSLEEKVRVRTEDLERANAELALLAHRDGLTGLYNRRAAEDRLDQECARHQRYGQVFSLLLIDIDHFKRINDTFGHAIGDEALKHVAQCLSAQCRDADFVARFGGEEFLVLLPATTLEGAMLAGEKLREAIAALDVPQVGRVTVSIGAAALPAEGTTAIRDVLKQADDALYEAKATGRNRTVAASAQVRTLGAATQTVNITFQI